MALAIFVALKLGERALELRIDGAMQTLAANIVWTGSNDDRFSVLLRSPDDLHDLPSPFRRAARRDSGTIELGRSFRGAETWRFLVSNDSQGNPLFLATPLDDGEEALELLAGILWVTVLAVAAVTLLIGFGAGLFAKRRVTLIDGTLKRLGAGELSARTGQERARDDLDDIARQLDVTAGELERLVTQTKHLSANMAHDMRTPLARLRSRLELLPEGEGRSAALEEATRLSDIFDTIMRVARIEAGQGTEQFASVELGPLVEEIAEIFGPVVEDADKSLTTEITAPGAVQGDRQMLIQAVANLIQNALIHGGDQIVLFARGRSLGVLDDGPGVEPTERQEVLKPMVRLDAARNTEGSGLGLALVRAVADRHSADLKLSEADRPFPAGQPGLCVTLKFA
ncbi:MAG: HAMP domain-containing sensor histidine kinase [Pseudomonadota bacterium]